MKVHHQRIKVKIVDTNMWADQPFDYVINREIEKLESESKIVIDVRYDQTMDINFDGFKEYCIIAMLIYKEVDK